MSNPAFWNKIARKYAATPVRNEVNYQVTLNDIRSYLNPSDHVLEIGCGTGSTAITLCKEVTQYSASDYAPTMIEIANEKRLALDPIPENVSFFVDDKQKKAKPEIYNAVLALNLLHLVKELDPMLNDIQAQLKPNGIFISKSGCLGGWKRILALPIGVMQLLKKAPYVAFRSARDYENALKDAGFEIVKSIAIPKGSMNRYIVARKR